MYIRTEEQVLMPKNWQETIREDIRCMEVTWREAIDLAEDRERWRDCVARCADMHRKD